MYTLKINKIIPIFVFTIAMFSNAFADPEVDKALIDIVYDGIEGKKFVIQPEIIPPNKAVRKKALELEPEMVFADLKFIMNFLDHTDYVYKMTGKDQFEGYIGYIYSNGVVVFEKFYKFSLFFFRYFIYIFYY